MMQRNEKQIDKLKVTKSRSTSNILKHKIGIALGKQKQVRQNSTNKKSMSKCSSYLGKQRSMSMRTLSKGTLIPKEKLQNSINRKLSFCNQQKTLTKQKQIDRNSVTSQSLRSSKTQRYQKNDSDVLKSPYNNLIWFDPSNNCKLKIVSKSIMTLGENWSQECIDYCIQSEKESCLLFKVQQNKLILIEKNNFGMIVFDQKSKKNQYFTGQKINREFSLSFNGYIFIHQSNLEMNDSKEKFNFILYQIQKLDQDGLKDFTIASKIVKRAFQSKFFAKDKQNNFCLLIKIQNRQNRNYQEKQFSNSRKKSSTAQQLIAQKTFYIKDKKQIKAEIPKS